MQHLELDTLEEFRHLIAGFWYMEQDFRRVEALPDGHAELTFHNGNCCIILRDNQPEALTGARIRLKWKK